MRPIVPGMQEFDHGEIRHIHQPFRISVMLVPLKPLPQAGERIYARRICFGDSAVLAIAHRHAVCHTLREGLTKLRRRDAVRPLDLHKQPSFRKKAIRRKLSVFKNPPAERADVAESLYSARISHNLNQANFATPLTNQFAALPSCCHVDPSFVRIQAEPDAVTPCASNGCAR
jgi:hypothetical protein